MGEEGTRVMKGYSWRDVMISSMEKDMGEAGHWDARWKTVIDQLSLPFTGTWLTGINTCKLYELFTVYLQMESIIYGGLYHVLKVGIT